MVLSLPHIVIRKHIQCLYVLKRAEIASKAVQIFLPVRYARNHHVADPYRYPLFLQVSGESQYIILGLGAELHMLLRVNMLDIQEYQVCGGQKPVKMGHNCL